MEVATSLRELSARLLAAFGPDADAARRRWLDGALERLGRGERGALAELFAAAARSVPRGPLALDGSPRQVVRDAPGGARRLDLVRWRGEDAARLALLIAAGPPPGEIEELFLRGDHSEKRSLARIGPLVLPGAVVAALVMSCHRHNALDLFEAAVCDSDAVAALLDDDDVSRVVLKCLMNELTLDRLLGLEGRARPELSRAVLDLAREREAAGRPVPHDGWELCARAPVAGVAARVIGDLEHAQDARRLAAARAVRHLPRDLAAPFVRERLACEHDEGIRDALRRALD